MSCANSVKILVFCFFHLPLYATSSSTISSSRTSRTSTQSKCWNDVNFKNVERALLLSPVLKIVSIEEHLNIKLSPFSSDIFILFLKNGLKAVFKPNRSNQNLYSAIFSYRFSQFMGWKLVPPTILRTVNGKKGSLQLFVDSDKLEINKLTPIQKSNIYIHYFILGEEGKNEHILLGKICKKPALIDNDKAILNDSFIKYGDYPFVRFPIKNLEFSLSSYTDYENFPIENVQSVRLNAASNASQFLKRTFIGIKPHSFSFFKWYMNNITNSDGNLLFVKWKNSYWIRTNFLIYSLIYKTFVPSVFSKKSIGKLKLLNEDILHSFLPNFSISESIIFGILYRRNTILKEASKLKDMQKTSYYEQK